MKKTKILLLVTTHLLFAAGGFAAGIYTLPILVAPPAPTTAEVRAEAGSALYSGTFTRDLADSDSLHWGEGEVFIGPGKISLDGEIAPGPAYRLYLSPEFVETEKKFLRLKSSMAPVADIKTFRNFMVDIPDGIDAADYNTVVIWCETFGQFITAARYRP